MNPLEKIENDKLNKSHEITKKYYEISNKVKVNNVNKLLKFADLELETLVEENKMDDIDLSELLELDLNQNSINTTNELKNNKNSNMSKNSEKDVRKETIEEEIVSNSINENKSSNKINNLDIVEDDEN